MVGDKPDQHGPYRTHTMPKCGVVDHRVTAQKTHTAAGLTPPVIRADEVEPQRRIATLNEPDAGSSAPAV